MSDASERSSEREIDAATEVKVTFPLHEALALTLLFERAPDDVDLDMEGVWYGESCDLAALRLSEAIAKATDLKEALLQFGALRARLAQQ